MDILTPELTLLAYQQGYFPMAEPDGEMYWHSPDPRAIIPLDGIKISRSLRKTLERHIFEVRFNTVFEQIIRTCANREDTWISEDIIQVYTELHRLGFAHSVETWLEGDLVGGLYGIALGGVFFGESMFSRRTDASKVCFVFLARHLQTKGFQLFDSQYINPHMASLGAVEIPHTEFMQRLHHALQFDCTF